MENENNYFPKRDKEIEIPDFLKSNRDDQYDDYEDLYNDASEVQQNLNDAIRQAEFDRNNHYHLKELDKQADAYSEDEAKVIVKRLVSNYPEVVLGEVADLIKDMQELSMVILQNSRAFANKRGEI